MWTGILAIYGAVVSTAALAVSYIAHRSGGPQPTGHAYFEDSVLIVVVRNRGRAPITVESFLLFGVAPWRIAGSPNFVAWELPHPQLPVRIEGSSGQSWQFPGRVQDEEVGSKLKQLEIWVRLGNGKGLTLKVGDGDIGLDGDMLSAWQPESLRDLSDALFRKQPERTPD